jgi:hypothetical protein
MFAIYTYLILGVVVAGTLWGGYKRNDTFHPLVYLMPMCGYLYVYMPLVLHAGGHLQTHFSMAEVTFVQGINLACVVALFAGIVIGDQGLRRDPERMSIFAFELTPHRRRVVRKIGVVLGTAGVAIFLLGIVFVGGFTAAFDSPKGGGWAPTGYLRDLKMLVIPGIVLLYLSERGRTWSLSSKGLVALFSLPLLTRAFLATSRGWLFMGAAALVGGWYIVHNRRPRLVTTLAGGTVLWILMMVLVSYRGEIYIGSDFFAGDRPSITTMLSEAVNRAENSGGYGNEFIYSVYAIQLAREEGDIYYGRRYLTYTVIRPIPSLVWPGKYGDVGTQGIVRNAGTLGEKFEGDIYERFPNGIYPGIVGDLFVEFAWGCIPAIFFFGWVYGTVWRRYLVEGGQWTVVYAGLFAMSVFAVMQTIAAAYIARILIVTVPTLFLWWRWMPRSDIKANHARQVSAAAS